MALILLRAYHVPGMMSGITYFVSLNPLNNLNIAFSFQKRRSCFSFQGPTTRSRQNPSQSSLMLSPYFFHDIRLGALILLMA